MENTIFIENVFEDFFESVYLDSYEFYGGDLDTALPEINYFKEGANLDSRKIYKDFRRKFKLSVKRAKLSLKKGDAKEAKREIMNLKSILKQSENLIKSCDSTTGSVVFGFFFSSIPNWKRSILLSLIPGVGLGISNMANFIDDVKGILDRIDDAKMEDRSLSIDDFNLYKNRLLTNLKRMDQVLDKLIKLYDKIIEKQKNK